MLSRELQSSICLLSDSEQIRSWGEESVGEEREGEERGRGEKEEMKLS